MPTAPTKLPRWATGAAAVVTEPTEGVKDTGSAPGYPIPAGHFNWLHELIYDWLNYLSQVGTVYTTLPAALDDLSAGDMAIIDEYDGDQEPGGFVSGTALAAAQTGNDVVSVDTSGDITVFLASDGTAKAVKSRWTLGNFATTDAVCTYTLTNAGTERVIRTNGDFTCIAYGQYVEIYDATAGTSVSVYDHGAAVYDICMDGVSVWLTGASGTGAKTTRKLTLATGAVSWSYNHNATTYACCTDGKKLYIAGAASGHASGATLRGIEAQTGWDLANEGGISTSGWSDVFDLVTTAIVSRGQVMVTDGRGLWIGYDTTQTNQIEQRGTKGGNLLESWDDTNHHVQALAIDQGAVYAAVFTATSGHLHAFDKAMFPSQRWSHQCTTSHAQEPLAVCTDGFMVTVGGSDTVGSKTMSRHYRRNTPARIRLVAPPDQYNPYRWVYQIAGE